MIDKNSIEQLQMGIIYIFLRSPEKLYAESFDTAWFGKYKKIVDAMLAVQAKGLQVDKLSVSEHIGGGEINVKTAAFLNGLDSNAVASPLNFHIFMGFLREVQTSERTKQELLIALSALEDGASDEEVRQDLVGKLIFLGDSKSRSYSKTMAESVSAYLEGFEKAYEKRNLGGLGIMTGIASLDKCLGGIHQGDLTVVGARPATGKTAFLLTVVEHMAMAGLKVGIISIEMNNYQVMGRLFSLGSGISASALRQADIKPDEFALLAKTSTLLSSYDVKINEKPDIDIAEIGMQCRAWSMAGLDIVFVDYLTKIQGLSQENRTIKVAKDITGLKILARTLNISVVCLAQLNRNSAGKEPVMSDLRDSGVIEQEADQILMLHRPYAYDKSISPRESKIIVEKNRHGETAEIITDFDPLIMKWQEKRNGY